MLVVLAVSFLLGGATSFAQGLLPGVLQPFANSASGWTILTAVLVWAIRRSLAASAVLGAGSFVALVLGYTAVSELRGFAFSPLFWSFVGGAVGPWVGAAAAALHERGWRTAVGAGLLAGVLLGDSYYGLTTVAATTGWVYWVLVGGLGVVLLLVVAVRRLRASRLIAGATATAVVVASSMNIVFALLNAGVISISTVGHLCPPGGWRIAVSTT